MGGGLLGRSAWPSRRTSRLTRLRSCAARQRRRRRPRPRGRRHLAIDPVGEHAAALDEEGDTRDCARRRSRSDGPELRERPTLRRHDIEIVADDDGYQDLWLDSTQVRLILGELPYEVTAGDGVITVDGKDMKVLSNRDPGLVAVGGSGASTVIQLHGSFFTSALLGYAGKHLGLLELGLLLISAPATSMRT